MKDVVRTLMELKEKRMDTYMLHLFMLFSAVRFGHRMRIFKEWSPDEVVHVPYLYRNVKRLEYPQRVLPILQRRRER